MIGFIVLTTFVSFSYDTLQSPEASQTIEMVYDIEESEIEISLDGIQLFHTGIDRLKRLSDQVNHSYYTSLELISYIFKPPITPIFS